MAVTKRKMLRTTKRAPTSGKKKSTARAPQQKKAVARTTKKTAIRGTRSARSRATASPLLTTSPKKIGTMPADGTDTVIKAYALNPFAPQDKTRISTPDFDPLALARPWMRLCVQMAVANFALQARMARTAMYLPPVAAALR
jgi:hypothetical protein